MKTLEPEILWSRRYHSRDNGVNIFSYQFIKKDHGLEWTCIILHAWKVLLPIINIILKTFLIPQILEEQRDFIIRGRNIRKSIEKVKYIYETTYDSVNWTHLWQIFSEVRTLEHLVYMIRKTIWKKHCQG